MPYKYDVFISYKRGRINEEWMDTIFYPLFEYNLDNALDENPRIFLDKTGLSPGLSFDNELFQNLISAKCLVAIWSPPYFRKSEWCIKEYLTMRYKQEFYHHNNPVESPPKLIIPIMYRKVNPLPAAVANINYMNYIDYNEVGDAFKRSQKYLDLQEQLEKDIDIIAANIKNVPPYNPEWDTPQGRINMLTALTSYLEHYSDFDNPPAQPPITW